MVLYWDDNYVFEVVMFDCYHGYSECGLISCEGVFFLV